MVAYVWLTHLTNSKAKTNTLGPAVICPYDPHFWPLPITALLYCPSSSIYNRDNGECWRGTFRSLVPLRNDCDKKGWLEAKTFFCKKLNQKTILKWFATFKFELVVVNRYTSWYVRTCKQVVKTGRREDQKHKVLLWSFANRWIDFIK